MTLIKTWASHFQSTARMKGREYQQQGRVKRLPPLAGELIRAEVQGSQTYTVTISGRDAGAAVSCTCAMFQRGVYCKHIWATILDHQYRPNAVLAAAPAAPEVGETEEVDNSEPIVGESTEEPQSSSLAPPKARKRESTGPKPPSRHEPEWIGRLSLLRSPTLAPEAGAAQIIASQYQVCYTINPELCASQGGMVVSVKNREPTQTGWSKPKPFRIANSTIAELADPVDRELCALIVGASPVYGDESSYGVNSGSMYDKFKLPRGSWRFLLQRIAATGRFYLEEPSAELFPLEWDTQGSWVLWMIADQDDNGLEVGVELRREGTSIAIQDPDVLLGGVDGIIINQGFIAPFDDGGATRWASQFRDGTRFRERLTSIRVPEPDITRFLDSLLQLPQLPEIEFPEGLFKGQRRGEFIPHLELFSHEYQDPTSLTTAPKGQLLARAWFAYDLFRVNPSDPGRYVTQRPPRNAKAPGAVPLPATEPAPASAETDANLVELPAAVPAKAIIKHDDAEETNHEIEDQVDGAETDAETEDPQSQLAISARELIRRDTTKEVDSLSSLNNMGFRHHPNHIPGEYLLAAKQMPIAIEELLKRGWVITADQRAIRYSSPPRLSITSGVDWFDLHATVSFTTADGAEQVIGLPQLLSAVREGRRMVTLSDGSQGLLPEQWLRQHALLAEFGSVQGDQLRFKTSQAALLDSLLKDQQMLTVDSHFEEVRRRLAGFQGITPQDPSKRLLCTLRPYQREGLGWVAFLRWFGMGGILADDMGLGKTVQILAMLDSLYSDKADAASGKSNGASPKHAPSLIVVPRSVIFNWIDEAKNFAPHLRVQAYTGAEREELRASFAHQDVIITSFGLMRRDINELAKQNFEYVVLDEAQAIKNPSSQSAKAARLIQANHRLALTGTPIENHLGDLWSIFEFLNPGMLGSATGFGRLVRGGAPEEETPEGLNPAPRQTIDAQNTSQITQALRPFILRRTKQQVLHDLPEKTEQTIHCELEPQQRALYEQLRKHYRQSLLGGSPVLPAAGANLDANPAAPQSAGAMMVLEALLRLRQAACHPGLIDPARADEPSAKLDVLLDRITDLIAENHKALVFSQFTSLLALVRKRLDERGITYEYLDGQTRHRRKHVHRFQTDPKCPLFLISLKAGGLGLNLTAADYVFILDPWWNPAVEAQAIDRAHRIGQTRRVFAYRLICQDTVEQRIAELQQKKKKLADAIIGGGQDNLLKALSREDLEQLLS